MKFFKLDGFRFTQTITPIFAAALGRSLIDKEIETRPFDKKARKCFLGMQPKDLAATFWLGSGSDNFIGDYDAKQFVERFILEFNYIFNEADKQSVGHLYIVNYGTLSVQTEGVFCMQAIADLLYENGFTKARVHALTPPVTGTSMRVKILAQTGSPTNTLVQEKGDVHAYLLSASQEKKLRQLERKLTKLKSTNDPEIQKVDLSKSKMEKKGITFVSTSKMKMELDRPHNTYYPGSPALRPAKNLLQEIALVKLEQQIRESLRKKEKVSMLIELHNVMSNEVGNWRIHIYNAILKHAEISPPDLNAKNKKVQACKNRKQRHSANLTMQAIPVMEVEKEREHYILSILEKLKRSGKLDDTVGKLLFNLYISDSRAETKKVKAKSLRRPSPAPRVPPIPTLPSDTPTPTMPSPRKSIASATIKELSPRGRRSQRSSLLLADIKEPAPSVPSLLVDAIDQIEKLIKILQADNKRNQMRCCGLFPRFFSSSTTAYKITQLNKLIKEIKYTYKIDKSDPNKWIMCVKRAQQDKRLVQSYLTSRTKNLLQNIVDLNPKHGTAEPLTKGKSRCRFLFC